MVEALPATMANAHGKDSNAMASRTVLMGAMRPQSYVEPTAKRWMEGGPAQVANASGKDTNAMEERIVMMGAMKPQMCVASTARM